LECVKCGCRRMGDASHFSRSLYLLVGGVLIGTPLKKITVPPMGALLEVE
jgi:hypothetical protein